MKDPRTGIDPVALDRHITGEDQTHKEVHTNRCTNGHAWDVTIWFEMGASSYEFDEEALCPECGEPDEKETDR